MTATSTSWLARVRRVAFVALGAVAAYAVAGYFGIPAAVRWGLETLAAREIGRSIRVDSIEANPFTLQVTLGGVTVDGAAGDAEPLASLRETRVDLSAATLLRLAPVVDAVAIDGLAVNVVRLAPQRFSFSDIIDRLQARPRRDDEPARFAVHNIEVAGSRVDFDDRVAGSRHEATGVRVGIPFISTLPADIEIKVQPAFAARLDGTPVELKGETRPFHETLESTLDIHLDGLDIPKYLAFLPARLNFEVPHGTFGANLRVAFRRAVPARDGKAAQEARLVVSGSASVDDFALAAPAGPDVAPLVNWKSLRVGIDEFEPLRRRASIGEIVLAEPAVDLLRRRDGSINWVRFAAEPVRVTVASAPDAAKASASPFALTIKRAAVAGGRVHYLDEVAGDFRQDVINLNVEATGLTTASTERGHVKLTADGVGNGSISLDGEVGLAPPAGSLHYAGRGVRLSVAARYLAQVLDATIDGTSDVDGRLEFASAGGELQLALRGISVAGKDIRLRGPKAEGAALDVAGLAIADAEIDLAKRAITIGRLALDRPRVAARRLADGTINWIRVFAPPEAHAQAEEAGAPQPWSLLLREAQIARGDVAYEDLAVEPAVRLRASAIAATVRNVVGDGSERADFSVRARLGNEGALSASGGMRWDRLAATAQTEVRNLDVAALRPYFAGRLNAVLARAELSGRGTVDAGQSDKNGALAVSYKGSARLSNLHLLDAAGDSDLLRWQALDVDRLDFGAGAGPPRIDAGKVTLSDFYARIVLSDRGRLNLADLVRPEQPAAGDAAKVATLPQTAARPAPAARIGVAGIEIVRGNVNFTDNFVRPNYTANLTDLGGTVGALSSDSGGLAEVSIRGRVDRDAPVEIDGRLDPFGTPLALDLRGATRGVDLPRLTPYSVKYAGYPITRGKLSMEVHYRIADDKLQGDNRLFLDQLAFGERVESPTATELPVTLAVALLQNSRGEIDVRLPISGSLDDPEFSLGGIIVQAIVNLLTKVVTAPFTVLAAAFGGGPELGYVEFGPGSAVLDEGQRQKLDALAKALADRPGLRLDMTGRAVAAVDSAPLRQAQFDARLRAAKVREIVRAGGSVDPDRVTIAADERERLIGRVYADEDNPGKPRNFLGIAKSIPAAEMAKQILATVSVGEEDLRRLANDRAAAVRDHLGEKGKVARERLFLVAPLLDGGGDPKLPPTRVDFSLK